MAISASPIQKGDSGASALIASGSSWNLTSNVTPGNCLIGIVVVASTTAGDVLSVTGQGTWHKGAAGTVGTSSPSVEIEVWYCLNATGGGKAITVTTSDAATYAMQVTEWSGVGSFVSATAGKGTTSPATLALTSVVPGCLAVVGLNGQAWTVEPSSPWAVYNAGRFVSTHGSDVAWQVIAAASTVTASWTEPAGNWGTAGIALAPGGTGDQPTPPPEATGLPPIGPPALTAFIVGNQPYIDSGNPSITVTVGVAPVAVAGLAPVPAVTAFDQTGAAVTVVAPSPTPQVTAAAGNAGVTVAALGPAPTVNPTAGLANVAVAGQQPTAQITVPAGLANVTVTGYGVSGIWGIGNAAVTVAGFGAAPTVTADPTTANSAVAGLEPVGSVTATAGVANVTIVADQPTGAVAATAGDGTVVVAGLAPTPEVTADPSVANVNAAGLQPTPEVTAFPGVANVSVQAYQPTVTAGGNVTANAGLANATVAADAPTPEVTAANGLANVTGAAFNPGISVTATAGVASVSVSASNSTPSVSITAGAASVTVASYGATPSTSPNTGAAFVSVGALNPAISLVVPAGFGPVTVAGFNPTASEHGAVVQGIATVAMTANGAFLTLDGDTATITFDQTFVPFGGGGGPGAYGTVPYGTGPYGAGGSGAGIQQGVATNDYEADTVAIDLEADQVAIALT